jgi:hypothetical protein
MRKHLPPKSRQSQKTEALPETGWGFYSKLGAESGRLLAINIRGLLTDGSTPIQVFLYVYMKSSTAF